MEAVVTTAPRRKRRTQEERRASTTSALIEATIDCLCELGYARTTTSELAHRAGCTTGAIQHHFGSKEELLLAVLTRLNEEFRASYFRIGELAGRPLRERCRIAVDELWAQYNAPRYLAIWEIFVGTRSEPELNQACMDYRALSIATCEAGWLGAFPELRGRRERLADIMNFVLTMLRSVGLNRALAPHAQDYDRQLELLREFVVVQIEAMAARPA